MKRFSSIFKSQRTTEVRRFPGEKRHSGSLEPFPAVVVPLPRRPLFPGFGTSAYLRNQPSLASSLTVEKTLAAFMLRDSGDYTGCILRPGLQGNDLLERLYPVGTLAEMAYPVNEETSRVFFFGLRRVEMTRCVVTDDPLTVMVQPLELEEEDDQINRIFQHGRSMAEVMGDYDVILPFYKAFELFEELSGYCILEIDDKTGSCYMGVWKKVPGVLADLGPALLPVLDKGLHQRALEERQRSKRLEFTTEILKRELELDNLTRQWDRQYEERCTEEEKRVLALVRGPGMDIGFNHEMLPRGEMPVAPSVAMRVAVDAFHKPERLDKLKRFMPNLNTIRIVEHIYGY